MLETLDTIIAFTAMMLLLSIFVTAGAQFTQAILRLRGRTLVRELSRALAEGIDEGEAKRIASSVARSTELDVETKADSKWERPPQSIFGRLFSFLVGPRRSWIEKEEFDQLVEGAGARQMVERTFERMEAKSAERFSFRMRFVAFGWACVVAVLFQVHTPELLARLSVDPELRKAAVVAATATTDIDGASRDSLAAAEALETLQGEFTDLSTELGTVEAKGLSHDEVAAAIATALEGNASLGDIANRFDELWRDALIVRSGAAMTAARLALEPFELVPLSSWSELWEFFGSPGRWLGVFMSIVLLSFGAPFWHKGLKNLINVRSSIRPSSDKGKGDSDAGGAGA